MGCKYAFVFIFIIFLLSFSSAAFRFSQQGSIINNQYGISDYLKAQINISFQNESVNSTFRDSLGNSIQLWEALELNPGYDYKFNDSTKKTVDSSFHILELKKANFLMPETAGNFTYQLNFSGIQIFKGTLKVVSIDNSVKEKIDEKYAGLNEYKTEIKKYDLYVQGILNRYVNITSLENDLKKVEEQYANAETDEEYNLVLENLSYITVPVGISENVNTNSITFYPNRDIINLEILKIIGGGDYEGNDEGYIDAIYFWNEDNLNTKLKFKEVIINYDSEDKKTTARIFEFEFDRTNTEDSAYFIIKEMDDLMFDKNYSQNEESGYIYMDLEDMPDKIIFSTTEDVDFLNVPAFVSPSIDNLSPIEAGDYIDIQDEKKLSKWILFGLMICLLLLIAVISYIIIQMWYKRKYENYLFKNRNNLYNIMTYIQTAKKKGMERDDIMKNLKKSGWTREQVNYALRKYEGKKIIGIIEKPFKKVISEIEKRPRENLK